MSEQFGCGFEVLEERTLLAANVTAVLSANGTLTITGDATGQNIYLYGDGTTGDVTLDVNGQTLSVNGVNNDASDDDFSFTGVKHIVMNTNGGDDFVQADDLSIVGNLKVNLGDNTDRFVLNARYNDSYIGGNVSVGGGIGNGDTIALESYNPYGFGLNIGGNVDLIVGNNGDADILTYWNGGDIVIGKNVTIITNSATNGYGFGSINASSAYGDISVSGKVTMNGGAGDDELAIDSFVGAVNITGTVTMSGNAGDDEMNIMAHGEVTHALVIDSYGYGDFRSISVIANGSVTTGAVTMNGGNGDDEMVVGASARVRGFVHSSDDQYGMAVMYGIADLSAGAVTMNGGNGDDTMEVIADAYAEAEAKIETNSDSAYAEAYAVASVWTGAVIMNGNAGDDTESFIANSVESANAYYGYGPAVFEENHGAQAEAYAGARLTINSVTMEGGIGSSSGNDSLSIMTSGLNSVVGINGAANLLGGSGDDTLSVISDQSDLYQFVPDAVNELSITGQLKLDGGNGNDDMMVAANYYGYGSIGNSILTANSLSVLGGNGADYFLGFGATILADATVSMGGQNDAVEFGSNSIGGTLLLNGGSGSNYLNEGPNGVGISQTILNFIQL